MIRTLHVHDVWSCKLIIIARKGFWGLWMFVAVDVFPSRRWDERHLAWMITNYLAITVVKLRISLS